MSATCHECGADYGTIGVMRAIGCAPSMCDECLRREEVSLPGVRRLLTVKIEDVLALYRLLLETIKERDPDIARPAVMLILKRYYHDSTTEGDDRLVDAAELTLDTDKRP